MTARRQIVLALIAIFACMGATSRTPNFVVHAPNQQVADLVAQWAEHYRKEKAVLWLGKEMAPWGQPCPLYVQVNMSGPSGATSFNFGQDQSGKGIVMGQKMEIQGPLDRLIHSVLPHEITHTVFAYHFKRPVPRWADEGGSVLSEDDIERVRHDKLTRSILNGGQQIQMRTLFGLTEYPQGKVMQLYAQGYSITNYLVHRSNRQHFLNFIGHGMSYGWDNACWTFYKHRNVDELETAWLDHLKETKGQDHIEVAKNMLKGKTVAAGKGTVVRLTVPPMGTPDADPIFRAKGFPDDDDQGPAPAQPSPYYAPTVASPGSQVIPASQFAPAGAKMGQPKYLPDYAAPLGQGSGPQITEQYVPVPVQLGPPQFGDVPHGPVSEPVSPVGFPK